MFVAELLCGAIIVVGASGEEPNNCRQKNNKK